MKGKFKSYFELCEYVTGATPSNQGNDSIINATPNKVSDPEDREKRQLATQAQQKLTKAKTVVRNPNADPSKKKELLKDLEQTRNKLRNVSMKDTIGDIESQLDKIVPKTSI